VHDEVVCDQIKAWVSQGSEGEVADQSMHASREPIVMSLERPRRAFQREVIFTDKDSHEIHAMSSSHMELRPFKDTNYTLRRRLLNTATQAACSWRDVAVQVRAIVGRFPALHRVVCMGVMGVNMSQYG
jgi:hypothetical protein